MPEIYRRENDNNGRLFRIIFLGEGLPSIFEVQAVKLVPTIYTGTYPTIKVISETIKDRSDLQGEGINGIVSGENWYNVSKEDKNTYGINI